MARGGNTAGAQQRRLAPIGSVSLKTYSNVKVYELRLKDTTVMRRKDNSYVNATHILKAANIEKGRRTKILEREVTSGTHQKIQGGFGRFQGTWIPLARARELARIHHVEGELAPLLNMPDSGALTNQEIVEDAEGPVEEPSLGDNSSSVDEEYGEEAEMAAGALLNIHQSPSKPETSLRGNPSPFARRGEYADTTGYDDVRNYYQSSSNVAPGSGQSYLGGSGSLGHNTYLGSQMAPPSAQSARRVFNGVNYDSPLSEGRIGSVNHPYLYPPRPDTTPTMGSQMYNHHHQEAHVEFGAGSITPGHGDPHGIDQSTTAAPAVNEASIGLDPEFMRSQEMESLRHMTGGQFLDEASAKLVKAIFETTTTTHLVILMNEVSSIRRTSRTHRGIDPDLDNESMPFPIPPENEFEVDVVLDENNNTALHYAAALGRVQIIESLRSMGAKLNCMDRHGETPLMKAVQHPYCWQLRNFPCVLEQLMDTIGVVDLDGRNVLHLVIAACLKVPMEAAGSYYLQEILRELQRLALTPPPVAPVSVAGPSSETVQPSNDISTVQALDDIKAKVSSLINGKTGKGATPNGYALFHAASAEALARFSEATGIVLVTHAPPDDALNDVDMDCSEVPEHGTPGGEDHKTDHSFTRSPSQNEEPISMVPLDSKTTQFLAESKVAKDDSQAWTVIRSIFGTTKANAFAIFDRAMNNTAHSYFHMYNALLVDKNKIGRELQILRGKYKRERARRRELEIELGRQPEPMSDDESPIGANLPNPNPNIGIKIISSCINVPEEHVPHMINQLQTAVMLDRQVDERKLETFITENVAPNNPPVMSMEPIAPNNYMPMGHAAQMAPMSSAPMSMNAPAYNPGSAPGGKAYYGSGHVSAHGSSHSGSPARQAMGFPSGPGSNSMHIASLISESPISGRPLKSPRPATGSPARGFHPYSKHTG